MNHFLLMLIKYVTKNHMTSLFQTSSKHHALELVNRWTCFECVHLWEGALPDTADNDEMINSTVFNPRWGYWQKISQLTPRAVFSSPHPALMRHAQS